MAEIAQQICLTLDLYPELFGVGTKDAMLVSFLRQLRNGRIACKAPNTFPVSIALIGLRNIRDYKMRVRPEGQSTGEESPFNVVTKAMTLRSFTEEDAGAYGGVSGLLA